MYLSRGARLFFTRHRRTVEKEPVPSSFRLPLPRPTAAAVRTGGGAGALWPKQRTGSVCNGQRLLGKNKSRVHTAARTLCVASLDAVQCKCQEKHKEGSVTAKVGLFLLFK